jgi:protein phosphatase methylesterase 1
MSDLQRTFAKAKLVGFPSMFPNTFDDGDEEEKLDGFSELPIERPDDDSSSASSASSTGTIKPTISKNLFVRPNGYVPTPISRNITKPK